MQSYIKKDQTRDSDRGGTIRFKSALLEKNGLQIPNIVDLKLTC